ncbi:MAG: glycosyltransferase family 4 protein [Brumimicrobium sp.]
MFVDREIQAFEKGAFPIEVKGVGLKGKGALGYIKSYFQLRKIIKQEQPDIIHAHYSFSGVVSILASPKGNVVVTFLGSDVFFKKLSIKLAKWLVTKKAAQIIVVSDRIRATFSQRNKITTIPQGIDIDLFKPMDKKIAAASLGWSTNKINILFPSSQNRYEKNYALAKEVIQALKLKYDIDFYSLEDIDPNQIPTYFNAADIVLLTSRWEGSSNVTKEAMACNTVVVSTDVGDASNLFKNTLGYYVAEQSVENLVKKTEKAFTLLKQQKDPSGRKRILELKLDDVSIAKRIITVYDKIQKNSNK